MEKFHKLLKTCYFVIACAFLLEKVECASVLFLLGGANYSHKMSIWPLVMALTEKGHNVTFVSSSLKQPKPNSKVKDITPSFMSKVTEKIYKVDRFTARKEGREEIFSNYEAHSFHLCNLTLNSGEDEEFNSLIEKKDAFDLVVANSVYGECGFYIAHRVGKKYVTFDSSTILPGFYGTFGIPIESSWIPDFISQVHYPLGLWGRVQVLFYTWITYQNSDAFNERFKKLYMTRFGSEDVPNLTDVYRNSSLVLVNSHYSSDFPRSLPPMFVHIGGMSTWEPEGVLPKDFKSFMDSSEDGVILISFGSTIEFSTLPEHYVTMFFNAIRKYTKIGFIWRWDGPVPDNYPKNLFGSKWLPQREILKEKSVRALMTHCGMNSILESTYYGVPVIAMPLFADQDFQAYRIEAQEIGVRIEVGQLNEEILEDAIWKILNTPTFKKNMETRSTLFRDRPDPTKTAVDALEFVLKHDDLTPLKPMSLDQSFFVRQHLDVYVVLLFSFAILGLISYGIFKICDLIL